MLSGTVAFLALVLLTLLDIRRGFLFADYPVRTLFYVFTPVHAALLAIGIGGLAACQRGLARREEGGVAGARDAGRLTFVILTLLVIDLFAYRGVPAARSLVSGDVNIDWLNAFGVRDWWRPVAQATSYLLNVWHATMLGILIAGLALTMVPRYLAPYVRRPGFSGSLLGAAFALPQPFCSCCSSAMAPSIARQGASTTFLLSFIVGAPMLNVTTIVLALTLLPTPFAITRIVAGVLVTVLITYGVTRIASRLDRSPSSSSVPADPVPMRGPVGAYFRLFDLDRIVRRGAPATPSELVRTWLRASGRIALVLVPTLWIWSIVAAAIFQVLPPAFGNNLASVVLAAIGGTFFMISTWSEIPIALQLIDAGFDGPAAALLVVLPAISLPCMMLLGGTLRRFRLVAALSLAVMLAGIGTGALFL